MQTLTVNGPWVLPETFTGQITNIKAETSFHWVFFAFILIFDWYKSVLGTFRGDKETGSKVHRPNSQSTFRRFDKNVSVTNSMNFEILIWIQTIFPKKNGIQKEWSQIIWNNVKMTNSDKMDRIFGWVFSNYLAAEFSRFLLVSNCLNSAKKSKV